MTIKHLVLSGGGPVGFITYGTMRCLQKANFWKLSDIVSIHACSIGAFMGAVIALNYDWDWLDDYFIRRPWEKITNITAHSFVDALSTKGLLGQDLIKTSLEPLLSAKGLTCEITLQEFFDYTGIELVVYTTTLNQRQLDKVAISHKTNPDLPLITAISMTMAVPILFKPVFYDGQCYIDGGFISNLPINDCITANSCDPTEILALRYRWDNDQDSMITEESSLVEYLLKVIKKIRDTLCTEDKQVKIPNRIESHMTMFQGVHTWLSVLDSEDARETLVQQGDTDASKFLEQRLQGNIEELA